jgi:hypothetical protein
MRRSRLIVLLAATCTVLAGLTPAQAARTPAKPVADTPYLGWSSWSLQSTKYPGVNTQGDYSWLTEQHVLQQAQVVSTKLRSHGYQYVNIDAGWWRKWDWTPEYDQYARPLTDAARFPDGMAATARKIHSMGLKVGIYMPVGLEKEAYNGGNSPIADAPGCHTRDVVYPDLRTTNGWDSSYKLNFDNPCAARWIDSIARMFAQWGVDFLKLDGVGPGSDKSGPNYDNTADVAAWSRALVATGRDIQFLLSWSLDHDYVDTWRRYSNGWRIDTDVECYCDTLVTWQNSLVKRFDDVVPWIGDAGRGGWNNLDSVDVGVGAMDGLTNDERRLYMTFWAIEAAPLYTGDDLTKLDSFGLSLLTNDEVIAIDQAGRPARPVVAHTPQQTWWVRNADGSYTVALFNLDTSAATVTANWSDFGFHGTASVRDVWSNRQLGRHTDSFSATLAPHSAQLLTLHR